MTIDDNVLLAYVNDSLPPDQRDTLEAILAEAPALRDKVNAMQASRLPYQAAFAAQRCRRCRNICTTKSWT
jgi:anti-sigma factor RsiW